MQLVFTVNDIATEQVGYTTTHLAMAAARRGHDVKYVTVSDFALGPDDCTRAHARWAPARRYRSAAAYLAALRASDAERRRIDLDDIDVLMLRNDPATDALERPWARLAGVNFGRLALRHGVLVLNHPAGLMAALTKLYLQYFPREIRPRTMVSRSPADIKSFIASERGRAVLKPLFGSGGRNVFLVRPEDGPNVNQMIEAVSRDGYVIAQAYVAQAAEGDTRVFLLNGQPLMRDGHVAAVHRVRELDEYDMRSNISAGAQAVKATITPAVTRIIESVRPQLAHDGMFLVGLDIAGDKLIEINVFSPGALPAAEAFEGVNFSETVIQALEKKVEHVRRAGGRFDAKQLATL
ncbi:MAG: glutathione synthase [Gammaproteobacteria bacterium]